jgi:hypothetical protein
VGFDERKEEKMEVLLLGPAIVSELGKPNALSLAELLDAWNREDADADPSIVKVELDELFGDLNAHRDHRRI